MKLTLKMHTVVLTVGPSKSGKSTFCRVAAERLRALDDRIRASIISSDSLRRELYGEAGNTLDSHDARMSELSGGAFELLAAHLSTKTAWPAAHEFVFVDTTGMDARFRERVRTAAKTAGYNVVAVLFDYSHGQYLSRAADGFAKRLIADQAKRFKQEVLPVLKRAEYQQVVRVKAPDDTHWAALDVGIDDLGLWQRCHLETSAPVAFIGDVHEDVATLNALMEQVGKEAGNSVVPVILGDWIDKGNNTKAAVEAVESMVAAGARLLVGNHERYVARRLLGEQEASMDDEMAYFSSLACLSQDDALRTRFLALVAEAVPFIRWVGEGRRKTVIATHAPCAPCSLGKLTYTAQKEQRNFRFESRDKDEMLKCCQGLLELAESNHPWHVFGHVPHSGKVLYKNQVWLDTGSVQGGRLSAFVLFPEGAIKVLHQASLSAKPEPGALLDIFGSESTRAQREIVVSDEEAVFIERFIESGAKFLSGTMAPAPTMHGVLEPLEGALSEMRKSGVERVVLEPKQMGSRCQVYLFRGEPERGFGVTRNGYRIRSAELAELWQALHDKYAGQDFWQKTLVLDGELMPWAAMGESLIEKEFVQYGLAVRQELDALRNDPDFCAFDIGKDHDASGRMHELNAFQAQVALYGQVAAPWFEAFDVLAADGESWLGRSREDVLDLIAPERPRLVLDIRDLDAETLARGNDFVQQLTVGMQMEGVVCKPLLFKPGMIPHMKVRNEEYLRIIYGYDYKRRYVAQCQNKHIGKKLRTSLREHQLGHQMLTADENALRTLLVAMLGEFKVEQTLDPRL